VLATEFLELMNIEVSELAEAMGGAQKYS